MLGLFWQHLLCDRLWVYVITMGILIWKVSQILFVQLTGRFSVDVHITWLCYGLETLCISGILNGLRNPTSRASYGIILHTVQICSAPEWGHDGGAEHTRSVTWSFDAALFENVMFTCREVLKIFREVIPLLHSENRQNECGSVWITLEHSE